MKSVIFAFVLVLISGAAAIAQDLRAAVVATIQRQLDAFQIDDFATAFTFASPNIKRLFGTPERFGAMVRNGYPMVWRPSSVEFLELRDRGGQISQLVLFRGANGVPVVLEYLMIQTEEGWQIDGVQPVIQPDLSA